MSDVPAGGKNTLIHPLWDVRFRSVVVITSASHAEGRRFEPGRKHFVAVRQAFVV